MSEQYRKDEDEEGDEEMNEEDDIQEEEEEEEEEEEDEEKGESSDYRTDEFDSDDDEGKEEKLSHNIFKKLYSLLQQPQSTRTVITADKLPSVILPLLFARSSSTTEQPNEQPTEESTDEPSAKRRRIEATTQEEEVEVALPVSETNYQQLCKMARPAPFGKGDQTVLDPNVRKSLQIDAENLRVENPAWHEMIQDTVSKVNKYLVIEGFSVRAELHKLLLYGPGDHFTWHQDGAKKPGMFATLTFILPSKYQGGAIAARFGSKQYKLAENGDQTAIRYVAWFADIEHSVEIITSGHRVALVYYLIASQNVPQPVFSRSDVEMDLLIKKWKNHFVASSQWFAMTLDHQYPLELLDQFNLGKEIPLKNNDGSLIKCLRTYDELIVFLGQLKAERDFEDSCDVSSAEFTCKIFGEQVPVEKVYGLRLYGEWDERGWESTGHEDRYTGNEELPGPQQYTSSCLLVCLRSSLLLIANEEILKNSKQFNLEYSEQHLLKFVESFRDDSEKRLTDLYEMTLQMNSITAARKLVEFNLSFEQLMILVDRFKFNWDELKDSVLKQLFRSRRYENCFLDSAPLEARSIMLKYIQQTLKSNFNTRIHDYESLRRLIERYWLTWAEINDELVQAAFRDKKLLAQLLKSPIEDARLAAFAALRVLAQSSINEMRSTFYNPSSILEVLALVLEYPEAGFSVSLISDSIVNWAKISVENSLRICEDILNASNKYTERFLMTCREIISKIKGKIEGALNDWLTIKHGPIYYWPRNVPWVCNCSNCQLLHQFLIDNRQTTISFKAKQSDRSHIECLLRSNQPCGICHTDTIQKSVPHTLVVTKTNQKNTQQIIHNETRIQELINKLKIKNLYSTTFTTTPTTASATPATTTATTTATTATATNTKVASAPADKSKEVIILD